MNWKATVIPWTLNLLTNNICDPMNIMVTWDISCDARSFVETWWWLGIYGKFYGLPVFGKRTVLLDCMLCIEEFISIENLKENLIKEISDNKLRNNYCSENDSIPVQLVIQYPVRQMVLYRLVYRSSSMKSSQNTYRLCVSNDFIYYYQ